MTSFFYLGYSERERLLHVEYVVRRFIGGFETLDEVEEALSDLDKLRLAKQKAGV